MKESENNLRNETTKGKKEKDKVIADRDDLLK
jgi:hypothetical protein